MVAYTFTTFGDQPEGFDATLDNDQLINAGIELSDAESHNVTFLGSAQEYTVKNATMRVQWREDPQPFINTPYFSHQQQTRIEKLLGTWIYPIEMEYVLDPALGAFPRRSLINSTVIQNFDTKYNWTKYKLVENGLTVFITTLASDDNNISKAILETGTVTVTVGSQTFGGLDTNFDNFGNWYFSVVTGQGGDWGLPAFMVWIVKIFSFLTLLSGILLLKQFVPFLN